MTASIHLGYEIGSGKPVEIPVRHMAITGQTQESGKTTTLEALICRSSLPAIAFVTKRSEGSFRAGNQIPPYFQERADWPFVEAILQSVMREKMKYERRWIVRACRGAQSLKAVQENCHQLQKKSRNDYVSDMYMLLGEYLDKVVPLIAALPKSRAERLPLVPGLNVMDLSRYPLELQMLVISSVVKRVHELEANVITIVPEAWKFVPERRNTPVKMEVEALIREGAGLKNYIWLDSQDMAGVDKLLLRACYVWLIGVQREANEVKRALSNAYAEKKPKARDIATLQLGQFFVSHGEVLRKVYVQPAWMEGGSARRVAVGELSPLNFPAPHTVALRGIVEIEGTIYRGEGAIHPEGEGAGSAGKEQALPVVTTHESDVETVLSTVLEEEEMPKQWTRAELVTAAEGMPATVFPYVEQFLERLLPILNGVSPSSNGATGRDAGELARTREPASLSEKEARAMRALDESHEEAKLARERLIQAVTREVFARILKDPVLIQLSQERPAIEVKIERKTVQMDGSSYTGRIATLIHDDFFTPQGHGFSAIMKELVRRGMSPKTPNVRISQALGELVGMGFFHRGDNKEYILAPGAEVRVVE